MLKVNMWWIACISIASCLLSFTQATEAKKHAKEAKQNVVIIEKYANAVKDYAGAVHQYTCACELYANACEKLTDPNCVIKVYAKQPNHEDQTDTQ